MDGELLSILAYFQEQLEEMSAKFKKLKDISYRLYEENEELKKENNELREIVFMRKKEKKSKAYSNLLHLYNEGYHICHPSFAERRKGDCLFCQKLIDSQLEE
ncbi:MAG: DNA replication initiation control protein YabA [Halanaerobiaceae bacterium]|jgi:regulator of replication initiation timing|nr:DNA replication initiation control protein YabA [Halanaerobiaceae bacterium]